VTALDARGLAEAVPPPPELPVIVSPPMTSAPPATVRDAEVKKYKGDDDCGAKPGDFEVEAFRLDGAHAGVVPAVCGNGAHNYFSTALIAPNAGSPMTRARFDAPNGIGGETVIAAPDLVNASYNQ